MGKQTAVVGGIITVLGTLVGIYIPFMGLWYFSGTSFLINGYAWFDILGSYHWVTYAHFIDQTDPQQIVQILGYIILAGGALTILGGLVGSRSLTAVGALVTLAGIVIFAISLQSILDTSSFYPITPPYRAESSLYFTFNQDLGFTIILTQALGGGFWACVVGIIVGLAGMSGMKK